MAQTTPVCDFDLPAPDFSLVDVSTGQMTRLGDVQGEKGTLVMFICNHCPYVLGALERLLPDVAEIQKMGTGVVAICSNDPITYPQDGPEPMKELAQKYGFAFPYLHDATQETARAYDAACTPDFFGFNANGGLQYRGRLDDHRRAQNGETVERDLLNAMREIAETGKGPRDQTPSMGCSIKWAE